ncbi:TetR/AcrR family transcriptional regulator [Stackebrandtia nassauensis]|uniref:Transcriptional regulator, TetR family n=1 Tax=Stackebrandtia nassauensis (strain DSM 44728 / CIP 108903 / NRRL B-16338 / NBRC 102104 / LLR-40K-21) TaxID=446470 RepID=D3Q932_STANL|nr:TetR/AcrR family transcriptional regulator [Stackebrandtia nassauensis]ADD40641.1 transcriptional regulator, TetR family [Stackebrandtia nassauensis DSM 44728]
MSTQTRKERERAQRHQLIITTARELAEADGWDAVTTRKLSERIEYSQPVLYSHFKGKRAIMDAVILEGCAELAVLMREARTRARRPDTALTAVADAYMDFGREHPATFDAMFTLPSDLPFGPEAPQPLKDAFAELYAVFSPLAGSRDPMVFTEVGWSAIHGVAVLDRSGRLPPQDANKRLSILVKQLLAPEPGD